MRTPEEAAKAAEATTTNIPAYCQLVTRGWLDAPSAGDFDGDGAADAEDGWKREPKEARRFDRKPPRGYPVTWLGGSSDNGHRALSLGPNAQGVYMIRSTDAGGRGKVATVPLEWVELNWGLVYAGWSTTMNGYPIPPNPDKPPTYGKRVDAAIKELRLAKGKGKRGKAIKSALKALTSLKPLGGK